MTPEELTALVQGIAEAIKDEPEQKLKKKYYDDLPNGAIFSRVLDSPVFMKLRHDDIDGLRDYTTVCIDPADGEIYLDLFDNGSSVYVHPSPF